jgi:NADPH-dependent ferric siderophore reductase
MSAMELSAETSVEGRAGSAAIAQICAEHAEYAVETGKAGRWAFLSELGSIEAAIGDEGALIRVSAADATSLAYLKMTVAEHLAEQLGSTGGLRWRGDGNETVPAFFRTLELIDAASLTPHLKRLRFAGSSLERFARGGLHVRLLFPPAGRAPRWPTMGADGRMVWPGGEDRLDVRVYTIRTIDVAAGLVEIDFVLHPESTGPASEFAAAARPGAVVGMIGPGGEDVPAAADVLLAGDDTALPAIARIAEALPRTSRATIYIEVDGVADELPIVSQAACKVEWLHRNGRAPGTAGLLAAALGSLEPAVLGDDLYVWAGCEFDDFRAIRRLVRTQWAIPKDRHLVVAYWRRGAEGDEARAARED